MTVVVASCGHCGTVIGTWLDAVQTHVEACCWARCFQDGTAGDGLLPEHPIRWQMTTAEADRG